jgi:cysteine desulfurase
MNNMIYLDNNATTKVDPRVLEAMMPFLTDNYANAASTHPFGVGAHEAVKTARQQAADLIGSETNEIIFTSGATEAINLAIKGVAENYSNKGKHIITVSTEHKAVLDTCEYLEKKGFEVTYLPVKSDGLIDLQVLKEAIRHDTLLVSVMLVNNEIGVIQPIKEIAEIAHEAGALFMTDGTQAVGKIEVDVDELGVDLMCFSGHKMYAPKGVGALFVRQRRPRRLKLEALIHGGGHERSLRSGTLNVPGIIALGKACEIAKKEMSENKDRIKELRDYLETELLKIEDTTVNGNLSQRIYSTTNILFKGVDSDAIIIGLDGIAVSNGSACTSASIEPSHVLLALGINSEDAFSSIRFSLGRFNFKEEITTALPTVKRVINSLKSLAI